MTAAAPHAAPAGFWLDMDVVGDVPGAWRLDAATLAARAGMNLGNLVFRQALCSLIAGIDRFVPVTTPDYRARTAQAPRGTPVILSCANWLGLSARDEAFNAGRAALIESIDAPVTAFGLGVQAAGLRHAGPVRLGPQAVRLARALADRGPALSVRDDLTRDSLAAAGIDCAVVTGCPSLFVDPRPGLGAAIADRTARLIARGPDWPDLRSLLAEYTGGHPASDRVLRWQLQRLQDSPAFHIIQTPDLLPFLLGDRGSIPAPYRAADPFAAQPGALERLLLARTLHFAGVTGWLDFARTCDIATGMRIHGCMVALQAGVPALLVAHDSRTMGLAQAMGMPMAGPRAFLALARRGPVAVLAAIAAQIAGFDHRRQALARVMRDYLTAHGLPPTAALAALT